MILAVCPALKAYRGYPFTEVKMKVRYLNFGENKVKGYKALYGDKRIECFYTDSYNDKALMEISDRVFIVKKGRLTRIK